MFRNSNSRSVPKGNSAKEGVQAKIALWNHLVSNRYRLSGISKLLDISPAQTQRLVDLSKDGASMEAIEEALCKLGMHFEVRAVAQPKAT